MIGRRRSPAPALVSWEEEGRRVAAQLNGVASAVVIGRAADVVARVAIGAARAVSRERRVAIADLVGSSPALAALAGSGGSGGGPGITDSFQRGISLNDVARPAADGTPSLFILPLGTDGYVPEDVLRSERWRRLAIGFADVGALLLIAARADTPALDTLVMQTDGVVAVGDANVPIEWRVIAQAGDGAPAAPSSPAIRDRRSRPRIIAVAIAVVILIAAAGIAVWTRAGDRRPPARAAARPTAHAVPGAPTQARRSATAGAPPADTVRVPEPVNPPDSAAAAQFAVELVATNTASGANLWLREHGESLPGAAVSPVALGAARTRWHKVLAGAWHDRAGADSLLAALRSGRVLRPGAGVVVRAPFALLLEKDVPRDAAAARVAALAVRGVRAYALVQVDGTVRVFAGAFETAAAAVTLDADLRAEGLAPQLAYRTGRTF